MASQFELIQKLVAALQAMKDRLDTVVIVEIASAQNDKAGRQG